MQEHNGTSPLASRLRQARIASGLTQAALAQRVGISQRSVSDLETARRGRRPDPAVLLRLASALHVDVRYLLGEINEPGVPSIPDLDTTATLPAPDELRTVEAADSGSTRVITIAEALAPEVVASTQSALPVRVERIRVTRAGGRHVFRRRVVASVGLLVAVVLIAFIGLRLRTSTSETGQTEIVSRITVFDGVVEVRRPDREFAPARTGDPVREGDSVRTGEGGHAVVTFFDNSTVVFEPESELEIQRLRQPAEGDIDAVLMQKLGKTWHVVQHTLGKGAQHARA